ncbi:hypothetical protein PInf_011719 [Phytophthora infestans]|nr:hypothetical protein PInf_011719 [Phytophthora infestans]
MTSHCSLGKGHCLVTQYLGSRNQVNLMTHASIRRQAHRRPYADKVPDGVENDATDDGTDLLAEGDLPSTSFAGRLSIGGKETAITGVSSLIVDIVAKKVEAREVQYLTLNATNAALWLSRAGLSPKYEALIRAFEDADRKKRGLSELRRNARLVEANASVDDADVLF